MTVPDTITRTFPLIIDNTYVANTVLELFHLRDMSFDADERVAVYLEAWFCNLNLKSFQPGIIPEFEGDETEREKMSLFTAAENKSQKIGMQILDRKNNTGNWEETAEIILVNRERKDYFDLMQPYLSKNPVRIVEKNDAFGIKLIDYGNGLLKVGDRIKITIGVTITIAKKNDVEALHDRISALETLLSTFGASSVSLPGTNGLVPAPPAGGGEFLLRGDREWQDPQAFVKASSSGYYGSAEIPATGNNGWNGLFFAGGGGKNYLMQNEASGDIGLYDVAGARWNFYATNAQALIGLPLSINNCPAIKKIQFINTIISLPSIPASGIHQANVSFSGVQIADYVHAVPIINTVDGIGSWTFYWHAQVLVPNTVSIFFKNDWINELDLGDFWIRIMWIQI